MTPYRTAPPSARPVPRWLRWLAHSQLALALAALFVTSICWLLIGVNLETVIGANAIAISALGLVLAARSIARAGGGR